MSRAPRFGQMQEDPNSCSSSSIKFHTMASSCSINSVDIQSPDCDQRYYEDSQSGRNFGNPTAYEEDAETGRMAEAQQQSREGMRLSKMREEDAAQAYESRRKELMNSLINKAHFKGAKGNQRPQLQSPENPEFVIFNVAKSTKHQDSSQANLVGKRRSETPKARTQKKLQPSDSVNEISLRKTPSTKHIVSPKSVVTNPVKRNSAKFFKTPQVATSSATNAQAGSLEIKINLKAPEKKTAQGMPKKPELAFKIVEGPGKQTLPSVGSGSDRTGAYTTEGNAIEELRQRKKATMNELESLDDEISKYQVSSSGANDQVRSNSRAQTPLATTQRPFTPLVSNSQRDTPGESRSHSVFGKTDNGSRPIQAEPNSTIASNRSPANRFEKNQKSGDFSNAPKEHLSYIKKPEDDQTEFPDESLLENLNSYSQNDKKQAKSHSEYLFKKAMVQQKVRAIVHQKNREQKEKEEIKQCTFKPILSPTAVTLNKNEDIVAKTKKWQKQQKEKAIKNQRERIARELQECTFQPNSAGGARKPENFNPEAFYRNNMEWQKKKELEAATKQNEILQSMTTRPEGYSDRKSRNTSATRSGIRSRSQSQKRGQSAEKTETESQNRSDLKGRVDSRLNTETREKSRVHERSVSGSKNDSRNRSRDSPSSFQLRRGDSPLSYQRTPTNSGGKKGVPASGKSSQFKNQHYRNSPSRTSLSKRGRQNPVEDIVVGGIKSPVGNDILESFGLFDHLHGIISSKIEKENKSRIDYEQQPQRGGHLSTSKKTMTRNDGFKENKSTRSNNKSSFTEHRGTPSHNNKENFALFEVQHTPQSIPVSSLQSEKVLLPQSSSQSVLVKKNRYYIQGQSLTENTFDYSQDLNRYNLKDISASFKNTESSQSFKPRDLRTEYEFQVETTRDQTCIPKPHMNKPTESLTFPSSNLLLSKRLSLTPPSIDFSTYESLNKSLTTSKQPVEISNSLESKFHDLLNQVSRVTQQLDKVKSGDRISERDLSRHLVSLNKF